MSLAPNIDSCSSCINCRLEFKKQSIFTGEISDTTWLLQPCCLQFINQLIFVFLVLNISNINMTALTNSYTTNKSLTTYKSV
uniref:Uncharacterized protein n=1 Tax=Arundo donax TaxID=35708 RepID=A0A0A9E0C3_ARUDO